MLSPFVRVQDTSPLLQNKLLTHLVFTWLYGRWCGHSVRPIRLRWYIASSCTHVTCDPCYACVWTFALVVLAPFCWVESTRWQESSCASKACVYMCSLRAVLNNVCMLNSFLFCREKSLPLLTFTINSFDQFLTKTNPRFHRFTRWLLYFNEWSGTVLQWMTVRRVPTFGQTETAHWATQNWAHSKVRCNFSAKWDIDHPSADSEISYPVDDS